jgi:hypothetical protein
MTYPQFTPYPPSMVDNIAYAQQLADQIMRNNPLVNAVIPKGLMKWYGNYTNVDGSKVNFLWIGEFLPADPNMGGVAQRGFSLVRDDPTHMTAISMYDRNPASPLRQTIAVTSWDGQALLGESRNKGGISFPRQQIPMNKVDGITANFAKTNTTTVWTLFEGRYSGTGVVMHYKLWALTDAGVTAQVRMHSIDGAVDVVGPWHPVPASGNVIFDTTMDVSAFRGHLDAQVYVEAQVLTGTGFIYCACSALTVYSD